MKMPRCGQLITLALLVHDLAWITMRPEFGIPAMTLGFILQTYLTVSSFRARSCELYCHASLLFWLIGNIVWTCAEYIWDSGYPVGFLSNIKFVTRLDPKWYPVMMYIALTIQTTTAAGLIAFYVSQWARWRQHHASTTSSSCAAEHRPHEPLLGTAARGFATGFVQPLPPTEAYVLLPWLPLRMYYELFTLPWIIMDTLWSYFDLRDNLDGRPSIICLVLSSFSGLAAICIVLDCMRRLIQAGQRSEAALSLAEGFWVTGNVMWMLSDSVTHWHWMFVTAVALFASGCVVVLGSMICTDDSVKESHGANFMRATSEASNEISLGGFTKSQSMRRGALTPILQGQEVVATVPEATKKKPKAWRPRKPTRLMKRVTVLPKGLSHKMPNFTQKVARLALHSYGQPQASIALLDLGQVWKQHSEWGKFLSRVHPYYAVHSNADKKIVQLLSQGGCSFACATAEEVHLVLSLGVSPEDILFCEACKLKTHLSFVKEKGVRLMPFDGAAELQKIAAEFPKARLLLQLAPPKDASRCRASRVSFGASCIEWASLLDLAVELGIEVVGASLRVCPGCEEWGSLKAALSDARDFFRLATELGHSMEVLDLGDVDVFAGVSFSDVAETMQEELSRWFPEEEFSALRVVASPGQLFTRSAGMLITQVISKEIGPQETDVACCGESEFDCPATRYVISAGVYEAFGNILTDGIEPAPPMVVSLGLEDRPLRRCQFLGPTRDELDIVMKDTMFQELEEGEWILWPRTCARTSATRSAPYAGEADVEGFLTPQVWYYAEDGSLAEEATEC